MLLMQKFFHIVNAWHTQLLTLQLLHQAVLIAIFSVSLMIFIMYDGGLAYQQGRCASSHVD